MARNDLISAFTVLASYGTATNLTGHDLGTSGTLPIGTLVAGVYSFDTTAQLNGILQLDAQGTNGGVWVFQIGSTLTTASASAVQLINPGGNLGADVGVYWVVGSSATLGTTTAFEGNILAQTSITLNTAATIYNGRALAIDGAVTLDTNIISDVCPPASSSPNSGPGFSLGGLGSIAWEKRDAAGVLLGGAQFTISPDPIDGVGILTILDNGPFDADPALGQILVLNALVGTYTVTETIAPLGYVVDADSTRVVIVSVGELAPVIGVQGTNDPGVTEESDFHNSLLPVPVGSIAWEKRDAAGLLLGGAQFTISPDPIDGVGILTILDNGPFDADPALGQILVLNALVGTYTVTETVAPLGYVLDPDSTRVVIVTIGALTQVIGVQGTNDPGVTEESDFHNSLLPVPVGSIAWEKRDAAGLLLGGAQFTISPDPIDGVGILTILDNGPFDADPALGQILVLNALVGTYTVTETIAPLGYVVDADSTRVVIVTIGALTQVIGVQGTNDPGVTEESDFHNSLLPVPVGSIAWEKRDAAGLLLGGAQFTISPDPIDGVGILTILDNGPFDADPALGQILVLNALVGTYTVTETIAPLGYVVDADSTRVVIVSVGELAPVIGVQGTNDPGVTEESDFHNRKSNVIVIGPGKSPIAPQFARVIDADSGAVLSQFTPYGNTFLGGIRIATGDLTGDGIDEIVTAPGWSIVAAIHVYSQDGTLLTSFQPYGTTFNGGVQVAVGDVDGDGLNDIITVTSTGPATVKVFQNALVAGVPTFDAANPYRNFLAFPSSFVGGAVVAVGDMGSTPLVNGLFNTTLRDQRAEIVVGSGAGMKATVKVFDVSGLLPSTPNTIPPAAGSFTPFSTPTTTYQGGVSLSVARINPDLIPDIVVSAGVLGRSMVDVWAWSNSSAATLASLSANGIGFAAFTDASRNSPVQVAAQDTDGDGIADVILAVQGPGGAISQIREFAITSTSPLQVAAPTTVPGSFPGPFFIDVIDNPAAALPAVPLQARAIAAIDYDYGDAPADYGTWAADDGARHAIANGVRLGATVDGDADGQTGSTTDSDDGVEISSTLIAGGMATLIVSASKAARLDAWIDFNRNGEFEQGERIADRLNLSAGDNSLSFAVPAGGVPGLSYARFRISSAGIALPTGSAPDGEVEDYALTLLSPAIRSAQVVADPEFPGQSLLLVNGTSGDDSIVVRPATMGSNSVNAYVGANVLVGSFPLASFQRIMVFGQAGNDSITIDAAINHPTSLYGDAGNDSIAGGSGPNSIFGGPGNDSLFGNAGDDRLSGGGDADSLTGGAGFDTVVESGRGTFAVANSSLKIGTITDTLATIEKLELTGSAAADTFIFTNFTLQATLDGALGTNTIGFNANGNVALTPNSLTATSGAATNVISFANIHNAILIGGAGANTFDITAWQNTATLSGGAGTAIDTFIASGDVDFTLSDVMLFRPGQGSLRLAGFERAVLTGGASNNTFNVSGWTKQGTLDGAGGIDKLVASGNTNFTLTDSSLTRSATNSFSLTSIEDAELFGGAGDNLITAAGFSGQTRLDGGSGNDTLTAGSGAALLLGGAGNDVLRAGSGRALMIGGLGLDRLTGGANDDILIDGTTSYDANAAALALLLGEWNSSANYADRVAHLTGAGGGLNGSTHLGGTKVTHDTAVDVLFGGLGDDLFFARFGSSLSDSLDKTLAEFVI